MRKTVLEGNLKTPVDMRVTLCGHDSKGTEYASPNAHETLVKLPLTSLLAVHSTTKQPMIRDIKLVEAFNSTYQNNKSLVPNALSSESRQPILRF